MYPTMNVCSVSSGLPQCYGMFLSRFDHPGDVVRAALKMDPWLVKPMRSEEHTHDMAIIGTMMMNQIYKAQICWNATIHHLIYNSSTGRLWHFSNVQHIIPKNWGFVTHNSRYSTQPQMLQGHEKSSPPRHWKRPKPRPRPPQPMLGATRRGNS